MYQDSLIGNLQEALRITQKIVDNDSLIISEKDSQIKANEVRIASLEKSVKRQKRNTKIFSGVGVLGGGGVVYLISRFFLP
jgi:capsule polysaccharide export protein KpsE/RkpR